MQIPDPHEKFVTWDQIVGIAKIVGPLVTVIIGLLVMAYKSMNKTIEKTAETLEEHVKSDDKVHDRIFTDIRSTDSKLDHLIGEHDAHKSLCPTTKVVQVEPQ